MRIASLRVLLAASIALLSSSASPTAPMPQTSSHPHVEVDVVALALLDARGPWAPWIDPRSRRPYRLADPTPVFEVDAELVEQLGREPLVTGLETFNGIPGSNVHVRAEVRERVTGDWRVVMRRCADEDDARARVTPQVSDRDGRGAWVDGATIMICRHNREKPAGFVRHLVAHELGHVLGLGHLCDEPRCWHLDEPADPCDFMYPLVHRCQDPTEVRAVIASIYPDDVPTDHDVSRSDDVTRSATGGSKADR